MHLHAPMTSPTRCGLHMKAGRPLTLDAITYLYGLTLL
jgi:hypothetical protein